MAAATLSVFWLVWSLTGVPVPTSDRVVLDVPRNVADWNSHGGILLSFPFAISRWWDVPGVFVGIFGLVMTLGNREKQWRYVVSIVFGLLCGLRASVLSQVIWASPDAGPVVGLLEIVTFAMALGFIVAFSSPLHHLKLRPIPVLSLCTWLPAVVIAGVWVACVSCGAVFCASAGVLALGWLFRLMAHAAHRAVVIFVGSRHMRRVVDWLSGK